nr:uncharacterized protein LOC113824839 [Penaeus vannamei]
MLKYVQVSPYRSSSALGGGAAAGVAGRRVARAPAWGATTPTCRPPHALHPHVHGLHRVPNTTTSTTITPTPAPLLRRRPHRHPRPRRPLRRPRLPPQGRPAASGGGGGVGGGRAVGRADSVSLNSSMSCSSISQDPLSSRSSSSTSLHDTPKVPGLYVRTVKGRLVSSSSSSRPRLRPYSHETTVRVWVRCLMQEMEYKTVCISYTTTCRDLVQSILSKFRMKHRDPNLFFLTMEVTVRKTGGVMRTSLTLEDDSRPAELQSCHPRGDSKFALKMRPGGLVRVYDGALVTGSQYKSLLVSERTTCDELIRLVLLCNNNDDKINNTDNWF